jgi:peptide deformylase
MRLAGMASNQVGVDGERVMLNACFIDTNVNVGHGDPFGDKWVVALNPEIVSLSGFSAQSREGCLTWPGKFIDATRKDEVVVRYRDLMWNEHIHEAEGFEAKVWQHEINHLLGVAEVVRSEEDLRAARPNDPCPCGSGRKFKKCCGR